MKKVFAAASLFVFLMSFTLVENGVPGQPAPYKKKHIDISVTATNGCIIHVVGDVEYSLIPPRLLSFTGTITLNGPKDCPHSVLTVNYALRSTQTGTVSLAVDQEEDLCGISKITWQSADPVYNELLADEKLNEVLVREIKSGICNDSK
jgi:hypothetical protein